MTEDSSSENRISVTIRHGDKLVEFSGDQESVWRSVNHYFSQVMGPLELLQRLAGQPDVTRLADMLVGRVHLERGALSVVGEADTKKRIALCLAGAFVGYRLGLLESESMTPKQVAQSTQLNEKTARNRLGEMWRLGLVKKVEEGRYAFSSASLGLIGEV